MCVDGAVEEHEDVAEHFADAVDEEIKDVAEPFDPRKTAVLNWNIKELYYHPWPMFNDIGPTWAVIISACTYWTYYAHTNNFACNNFIPIFFHAILLYYTKVLLFQFKLHWKM